LTPLGVQRSPTLPLLVAVTGLMGGFGAGSLKFQIDTKNGKRPPKSRACTTL
jgi:hypothetical protein